MPAVAPPRLMLQRSVAAAMSEPPSGPQASGARALPLAVIEIPDEPVPGMGPPSRRHHALRLRFEAAERTMRSWGVDASDCAMQLRMPSRVVQRGSGSSVDITAQLRLGCSF